MIEMDCVINPQIFVMSCNFQATTKTPKYQNVNKKHWPQHDSTVYAVL